MPGRIVNGWAAGLAYARNSAKGIEMGITSDGREVATGPVFGCEGVDLNWHGRPSKCPGAALVRLAADGRWLCSKHAKGVELAQPTPRPETEPLGEFFRRVS